MAPRYDDPDAPKSGYPSLAGVKVTLLYRRAIALSHALFIEKWQSLDREPDSLFPYQEVPGLREIVRNTPAARDTPIATAHPAPFDLLEELRFDKQADALDFLASPAMASGIWRERRTLLHSASIPAIFGASHVMWERPAAPRPPAVKLMVFAVRRKDMTVAEFRDHWLYHHSPLALAGPGSRDRVRKVEFCPADDHPVPGLECAGFDGAGTIWFDDLRDMDAEFSSEYYARVLRPDEEKFVDPAHSRGMMVRQEVIYSRPAPRP